MVWLEIYIGYKTAVTKGFLLTLQRVEPQIITVYPQVISYKLICAK